MGWIKNDTEKAVTDLQKIRQIADEFNIRSIEIEACVNVSSEVDCTNSYQAGVRFLPQLKKHVSNACEYINQINEALDKADHNAVKSTSNLQ